MTTTMTMKDKYNKLVDWLGALGLITMVGWLKGTIAGGTMVQRQDGTKTRYDATKAQRDGTMAQSHNTTMVWRTTRNCN